MDEKLLLFHGTNTLLAKNIISRKSPLIGKRIFDKPKFSGTLTNNYWAAEIAAHSMADVLGKADYLPVILVYEIPTDELICEGPIGNRPEKKGVFAYSTIHKIAPHLIPSAYLDIICMTLEEAIDNVKQGKIEFTSTPSKYLQRWIINRPLIRGGKPFCPEDIDFVKNNT